MRSIKELSAAELRKAAAICEKIQELEKQLAQLGAAVPTVTSIRRRGAKPGRKPSKPVGDTSARKAGRSSAAVRKATSARMKKWWAARRAVSKATTKPAKA